MRKEAHFLVLLQVLGIRAPATYRPHAHSRYERWGAFMPGVANEVRLVWAERKSVLDPVLVSRESARVVAVLGDDRSQDRRFDSARYWSILKQEERIFLTARYGKGKSASKCMRIAVFANCTDSLGLIDNPKERCLSWSRLRMIPRLAEKEVPEACGENIATNLGLVLNVENDEIIALGGEAGEGRSTIHPQVHGHKRRDISQQKTGIAMLRAVGSIDSLIAHSWSTAQRDVIQGNASGCLERFFKMRQSQYLCKFDSQLSLVYDAAEASLRLYARANLNISGGGRSVQTTRLSAQGQQLEPFQLIRFLDGDSGYLSREAAMNDIYIFLVNENPIRTHSFLALFPIVLRSSNIAFLALACSLDGILFSPPWPILKTETFREGRPFDLPVDGFISTPHAIHFFLHVNVQGIVPSAKAGFPPHLVRFSMPRAALEDYTERAIALLLLEKEGQEEENANQQGPSSFMRGHDSNNKLRTSRRRHKYAERDRAIHPLLHQGRNTRII